MYIDLEAAQCMKSTNGKLKSFIFGFHGRKSQINFEIAHQNCLCNKKNYGAKFDRNSIQIKTERSIKRRPKAFGIEWTLDIGHATQDSAN